MTFSPSHSSQSTSSRRGSFPLSNSKGRPLQLYAEILDRETPARPEDVKDFAARIGINVDEEPHLLYLAHDGLRSPLPETWIPVFDRHKDSYFYHNSVTTESRWENPLDSIYSEKVKAARAEHALKKIQKLDMATTKPAFRGLPPLKRSEFGGLGGSLNQLPQLTPFDPLNNPPSRLGPLLPLPAPKSGLGGFPTPNPSVGRLQPMVPIPLNQPRAGLLPRQGNSAFTRPNSREKSPPELKKQDSTSVSNSTGTEFTKPKILGPSGSGSAVGLSNSRNSFDFKQPPRTSRALVPPIPRNLAQLGNVPRTLDSKLQIGEDRPKAKGNVRFNLDEDPELKFDLSSKDSDDLNFKPQTNQGSESGDGTSEDDTEIDDEDSESGFSNHSPTTNRNLDLVNKMLAKVEEVKFGPSKINTSRPSTAIRPETEGSSGPKRLTPPTLKPYPDDVVNVPSSKPFVKQIPKLPSTGIIGASGEKMGAFPAEIEQTQGSLRVEMENQLKKFQNELDKEREDREQQMRKNTDKTIATMKADNEGTIKKLEQSLKDDQTAKLQQLKAEQEARINAEIQKINKEFEQKLKEKRDDIRNRNEKAINEIETETLSDELTAMVEAKRREALTNFEKEAQDSLQEIKAGVKRDHEKQIEQMRAYQKTFMDTLQNEFKHAEDKARKEQESTLFELHRTFDEEKAKLMETCRTEQEADLQKLNQLYANRREVLEAELKASEIALEAKIKACAKDRDNQENLLNAQRTAYVSNPIENLGKPPELESRERQVENLKSKYKKLQEKYVGLKQDLSSVVTAEQFRQLEESKPDIMFQNGHDDSDTDEETGASYEISESVAKRAQDSKSDNRIDGIVDQNDRLNQALAALEMLRSQILDMSTNIVTPPKESRSTSKEKLIHRKSASQTRLNVYPTKQPSETNVIPLKPRPSRSATNVEGSSPSIITNGTHNHKNGIGVGDHEHQIVQEAKDFIRAQKQRLNQGGLNHGHPKLTFNAGAQQQRRISDLIKDSVTAISERGKSGNKFLQNKDLFSETESSGVGSLKSHQITDKSQVARDIDGILVSLKKLDHQMKHLWSMVGQEKSGSLNSDSTADINRRGLLAPLIHPMSPNALAQLSRMSKVGVADNPLHSLLPSMSPSDLLTSRYSLGPEFSSTGLSNKMGNSYPASTPLMPQLSDHVQNFKNRRDQIMNDHFTQNLTPGAGSELPESLLEKTKDLREWLEKF